MIADRRVAPALVDTENPWPGLSSFDEAAQGFFSGRDAESAQVVRLVRQAPLAVLFGKSGLGKTSLLQAGVFPRLRQQNLLPVYVRLDVHDRTAPLIEQVAHALGSQAEAHRVDATVPRAAESVWEYLHGHATAWWSEKNQPLTPIFAFDQFEEVFTIAAGNAAAIDRLRVDLADLVENRIPADLARRIDAGASADHLDLRGQRYKVIISFREDFLPDVEGWKAEIPSVMRNRLRLLSMSAERAQQVVTGHTPEGRTHTLVDEATAREIVRFVAAAQNQGEHRGAAPRAAVAGEWDQLEIEPALLSLVCAGLNGKRQARGQTTIDAPLLKEVGAGIIAEFYARCVADVPERTRRFIEDTLITEAGFRNSHPVEDALATGVLTEDLLRRLVDRRLLRVDHQIGVDRVELIHDRLTAVVLEHRDRERERIRQRRQRRLWWAAAAAASVLVAVGISFFLLWKDAQGANVRTISALAAAKQAQEAAAAEARRANTATRQADKATEKALASLTAATVAQEREVAAGRETRHTVARFAVQDGERLVAAGRRDQALAHFAYALRSDPESAPARAWIASLLRRPWLLPQDVQFSSAEVLSAAFTDTGVRLLLRSVGGVIVFDTASGTSSAQGMSIDGIRDRLNEVLPQLLDGNRLLMPERQAKVYDATRGEQIGGTMGDGGLVVATSGNGRYFLTDSRKQLRVWDVERRQQVGRIDGDLNVLDLSADGTRVLAGAGDGGARIWDAVKGVPVGEPLRPGDVIVAKFSPDGRRIITGFRPNLARLWDSSTGKPIGDVLEHGDFVDHVGFSADSRRVFTGSNPKDAVKVWDVESTSLLCEGMPREDFTALNSDGSRLLTADGDAVQIWDVERCALAGEPLRHDDSILYAAFSDDARRVLTHSRLVTRVWSEVPGGRSPAAAAAPDQAAFVFRPDGRRIVIAQYGDSGQFASFRLWNVDAGIPLGERLDADDAYPLGFAGRGKYAVFRTPDGVRILDADTGRPILIPADSELGEKSPVQFTESGGRLLVEGSTRSMLWDLERPRAAGVRVEHVQNERLFLGPRRLLLRVSPDGGMLTVWDFVKKANVGTPLRQPGVVDRVHFSPDERRALLVTEDGEVQLLDLIAARLIRMAAPAQSNIVAELSGDGRLAVLGLDDGSVHLFNTEDGSAAGPAFRQPLGVHFAALSLDGALVVTGHFNSFRLWDANKGTLIGEPIENAKQYVPCAAAFSRDGRRLLVRLAEQAMQAFDTVTGRALGEPIHHEGNGCGVFVGDGFEVVTSGEDGTVPVIDLLAHALPASELVEAAETLSGYRVSARGSLDAVPDRQQRRAGLRWLSAAPDSAGRGGGTIRRLPMIGFATRRDPPRNAARPPRAPSPFAPYDFHP